MEKEAKPRARPRGKPFEKGCAPGPGRPKGLTKATFYSGLRDYLETTEKSGRDRLNQFMVSFFEKALSGEGWQANMLAERLIEKDFLDKITTQLDAGRREDADFMAYRALKDCFGQQLHYAWSKSRLSAAMAGRRAGKTEGNVRCIAETVAHGDKPVLVLGLTFATVLQLYWDKVVALLGELGLDIAIHNRTEGHIKLANGSEIYFRGNSTKDEREKLRGFKWALVIVDEVQSQKALAYLLDEILVPACVDLKGRIKLSGTGPRIRGTYWEVLWNDPTVDKYNWNLLHNPHIPDGAVELARIREAKGLTEASPLYVREYLGQMSYDDDALVFRLGAENYYEPGAFHAWLGSTPASDLHVVGGLDFGFEDADAFAVIIYADYKPERWLVHEYKQRREGMSQLAEAIKAGLAQVRTFPGLAEVQPIIYADSAEPRSIYDLSTMYGLPITQADKAGKNLSVENLQEDVRCNRLRVRKGGAFDDEALRTVFKRDEADNLTREIDDETYHPDMVDAVRYAMRAVQQGALTAPQTQDVEVGIGYL